MRFAPFNSIRSWRGRWQELLRDPTSPRRTALAFALGIWIGLTPVIGLHTWIAFGVASLLRLPPLAALLASNVSNPLTFIPITLAELRVGAWLLGREFRLLPKQLQPSDIGHYLLEAWLGWALLGTLASVLAYWIVRRALLGRPLDAARARS